MNYERYVEMQLAGPIIKPIHYHIGEFKAMEYLLKDCDRNSSVLDVGCGIGYGVGMLKKIFGFKYTLGIDLNPDKIKLGKKLGYNIYHKDIVNLDDKIVYDIVWCSHTFEHMLEPDRALEKMKRVTSKDVKFFFILPYPDMAPSPVHHSAPILGTNIDDKARTVIDWFTARELSIRDRSFSGFREPEIWLEFTKL